MRQENKIKISAYRIPGFILLGLMVFVRVSFSQPAGVPNERSPANAAHLKNTQTQQLNFTEFYFLTPIEITLKTPQYDLPLKVDQIINYDDFSKKILLSDDALKLFKKNGFVVISNPFNPNEEYITKPYSILKSREIPIFITSDSLLHLYHIQFDETLREIEEKEFYDKIWKISKELLDDSIDKYEDASADLKKALKINIAYFSVGLSLLVPKPEQVDQGRAKGRYIDTYFKKEDLVKYEFEIPLFVKSQVEKELNYIKRHSGFKYSTIFKYKEDYSQYLPRGHYTRSERLKNYFKTLMWYGRMSFLLKGGCNNCLVSKEDARIQSIAAALIASRFDQSPGLKNKWDRIYSVTAFYVGVSDDLGPYEYLKALNSTFGYSFDVLDLTEKTIGELKAKLAEYRAPKIYGGTGDCVLTPPFRPEQADQCIENTRGFRLMGQRFIPDSYVFSSLVGSYTGVYQGDKKPFTLTASRDGRLIRGFPRGLDAMAFLGSKRAKKLLGELDDSNYKQYHEAYRKLEEKFNALDEKAWNKNLYWSWLFSLRSLLKAYGAGYPTFMQTKAWQDKQLTTALASWAELRHDTILYAKQSYTMANKAIIAPKPEKPLLGYIEPVPEFYNRLLALTKMTTKGLEQMDVINSSSKLRLDSLETILKRLVEISKKELNNEELTIKDYGFIHDFGDRLNSVVAEVDEAAKKTTIIADVHTNADSGQVLEEALGYVNLIIVSYRLPDGRILMGAGPVTSYYEFKQPMGDRLADEKWREMLNANPPERPPWVINFTR